MKGAVVKRSIAINNHKTSVSLEDEFWSAIKEIAQARTTTISSLISAIDTKRKENENLNQRSA